MSVCDGRYCERTVLVMMRGIALQGCFGGLASQQTSEQYSVQC